MTDDAPTGRLRSPARLRLAGLAGASALALVALMAVGPEIPGPPAAASIPSWTAWEASVGPAGVVMAVVRGLALVTCGYLLVVVTVELAAQRFGLPGLVRAGRHLWVPWVRAVLGPAAGAGLLVAVVTVPALAPSAGALGSPAAGVVMHQEADPPAASAGTGLDAPPVMVVTGSAAPSTTAPESGPPVTDRRAAPTATPTTTTRAAPTATPTPDGAAMAAPAATDPVPPVGSPAPTWTIRAGDHLWRVSATTLGERWHVAPTDAQVLDYLDVLVAANRDRLVVPGNADLVYPGQVFVLPAVPAAPT